MSQHPPRDGSDLAALAGHLQARRDEIINDWTNAVREDAQIPSADRLTLAALEDHFPEMLDELNSVLAHPQVKADAGEIRQTGGEHGKARWRSGYRLDEVLRELARMREILLAESARFAGDDPSAATGDEAARTIRHFFDTIVATSARQFIQEQQAEVLLRSRQLQHAYEQVQAATEELRELSQSRLRLLRTVSHELRNFLNAVNLAAQSLLEESHPLDRQKLGNSLTRSVVHLQTLLDRLREYSEILAGENHNTIAGVNLAEFLRGLEAKFRPLAERKGLCFESYFLIDDPMVQSDIAKLQEIGANLLSNAINFTSEGVIRLSIAGVDQDRWILRVEDTGTGIEPAGARHIFSEFHYGTDASQRHGIGLGLAITRHVAHLLGGEITFQTAVGKGRLFEVNLPRCIGPI